MIAAGFHRVDPEILAKKAPTIKWGEIYKKWTDKEKVAWHEKFSSSMNHAAALIQDERDKLNVLCHQKEQQLRQVAKAIESNNAMLQQEVTRMNEQRQGYNAQIAKLNAEIRALKNGH